MATEEEKQAELLAQARRRLEAGEDILNLTREQAAAYQAEAEVQRKLLESDDDRLERLKEQLEKLQEQTKVGDQLLQAGLRLDGLEQKRLDAQFKLLEAQEEELNLKKQKGKIDEADYLRELKKLKLNERRLSVEQQGLSDAENLIKRATGISKTPSSLLGKIAQDPQKYMSGLMNGSKGVINATSILTSTIDKVVETTVKLAIEQDQAIVTFNKATGASEQFDGQIRGLERSLFTSGVTAAESGQAFQDLFMNVSDFTTMNEQEQKVLAETTAILNELGVSSKDTAANIQLATKGLGMSVIQADKLVRGLNTFAVDIGVSTAQLSADFAKMGPMIAELGTDGVRAFKNLAKEAKVTGIDINRLFQITAKFDTFEGAAQSVGKLNAMLGGPFLNTMDMLMEEDPAERMRMLKEAVDDAGLSFDTMSKFQRKALAESMGLNDANELALVLRGRQDLLPGAERSAQEIEDLQQQTKDFNTVMDELSQVFMGFAISMGPFVSGLKTIMQGIQPLMPALVAIGLVVAGLAAPFGALTTAIGVALAGLMALSTYVFVGASPSFIDTAEAITTGTEMSTVAFDRQESSQRKSIVTTQRRAGAVRQLNTVQSAGIAGTTAATGMPAAAMMASSNQELASSMSGQQGPIILELDGREFARQTDMATSNAIGTKLTNRYA
ncbi:MAG: hypothetical protein CMA72_08810 [Euryarchaeota archaeon]|nr:hypothetical protein [Euryarchaeota archaeon]